MSLKKLKASFLLNGKNVLGWKTDRKIVVFSIDDYGNVRLASAEARRRMVAEGLDMENRFDMLDTLETRQDLEMLYEVLASVKDISGRNAVVTPYVVPCNIDFEKMEATGYGEYCLEMLPETFEKLSVLAPGAYRGTWELWKEGIEKRLMVPQFHGREHINLNVLEEKLAARNHDLLISLKNRSYAGIASNGDHSVSAMAAFDFWMIEENQRFHDIIRDGLDRFEHVFGYRAHHLAPPCYSIHPVLFKTLRRNGIRFVDTALIANEHQGEGRYRKRFNYTAKSTEAGICLMVRNVVFEPTSNRNIDWPSYVMEQIETAFRWRRPAVISSHRVNFCGHIDPENRKSGLKALAELLKNITERWPDVEFMTVDELGTLIWNSTDSVKEVAWNEKAGIPEQNEGGPKQKEARFRTGRNDATFSSTRFRAPSISDAV